MNARPASTAAAVAEPVVAGAHRAPWLGLTERVALALLGWIAGTFVGFWLWGAGHVAAWLLGVRGDLLSALEPASRLLPAAAGIALAGWLAVRRLPPRWRWSRSRAPAARLHRDRLRHGWVDLVGRLVLGAGSGTCAGAVAGMGVLYWLLLLGVLPREQRFQSDFEYLEWGTAVGSALGLLWFATDFAWLPGRRRAR